MCRGAGLPAAWRNYNRPKKKVKTICGGGLKEFLRKNLGSWPGASLKKMRCQAGHLQATPTGIKRMKGMSQTQCLEIGGFIPPCQVGFSAEGVSPLEERGTKVGGSRPAGRVAFLIRLRKVTKRARAAAGMGTRRARLTIGHCWRRGAARLRWLHLRRVVVVPACVQAGRTPALLGKPTPVVRGRNPRGFVGPGLTIPAPFPFRL